METEGVPDEVVVDNNGDRGERDRSVRTRNQEDRWN